MLKEYRQELHQIPELELDLPQTQTYIKQHLQSLRCELFEPIPSSVVAYFDFGKKDTFAFRSDMDALPVQEQNDLPYKSKHPGCMHACGHDGHMAILLGFAQWVNEQQDLPHNVLLVFQPGEESPGGAKLIVDTGIFEKFHVTSIFGLHLWPSIEKGAVATRPKGQLAQSSEIHVDIEGKTSHVAKAEEGIDAMVAGAHFLLRCYEYEKSIDPGVHRLLKFGLMRSGVVCNSISGHTHMEGTMRVFDPVLFDEIQQNIKRIANEIEQEEKVKIDVQFKNGYPAVINDEALVEKIYQQIPYVHHLEHPEMIAEDFAYYQQALPGVFFFLGTGTGIPLHSDHWDFDEEILTHGVELYMDLIQCL